MLHGDFYGFLLGLAIARDLLSHWDLYHNLYRLSFPVS